MINRCSVDALVVEGLTRTASLLQDEIVATRLKLNSLESLGAAYRAALEKEEKTNADRTNFAGSASCGKTSFSLVALGRAYLLIGRWILERFQVPAGTIYLTGEILRAA